MAKNSKTLSVHNPKMASADDLIALVAAMKITLDNNPESTKEICVRLSALSWNSNDEGKSIMSKAVAILVDAIDDTIMTKAGMSHYSSERLKKMAMETPELMTVTYQNEEELMYIIARLLKVPYNKNHFRDVGSDETDKKSGKGKKDATKFGSYVTNVAIHKFGDAEFRYDPNAIPLLCLLRADVQMKACGFLSKRNIDYSHVPTTGMITLEDEN